MDWPLVRSWNVESGQFFTEQDDKAAAKVCVLGQSVVTNLFGSEDPIGKPIRIKNIPFKVVGVLEAKGGSAVGQDQDDIVVAPYETVRKKLMGTTAVGQILVSASTNDLVSRAQEEITGLLRQRHRINKAAGQDDDFIIRSQTEMIQQAEAQNRTMSALLWSIAGVSLLVGGIGIMNIMLVSVTERTREIGVRMAIGAQGARHPGPVPRRGRRARRHGRRGRRRRSGSGSSASSRASRAGRSRSSRRRSSWRSSSRPSSASASASTRPSRRAASTRSRRCGTSRRRRRKKEREKDSLRR